MTSRRASNGIAMAFVLIGSLNAVAGVNSGCGQPSLDSTIRQLAAGGEPGEDAATTLREMPSEQAVPALIEGLRADSVLEGRPRVVAYGLLRHHRAARWPTGFEQLVGCLDEQPGNWECVAALADSAPSLRDRAIAVLLRVLRADNSDISVQKEAVRALGALDGREALPEIKELFLSESTASSPRMWAAQVIVSLDETQWLLRAAPMLDSVGLQAAIAALAQKSIDTSGEFGISVEDQEEARQLILTSLRASELDTRKAALEALLPVFLGRLVVPDPSGTGILDPRIEDALKTMGNSDPDDGLRDGAVRSLEQLRRVVDRQNQMDETRSP